jgi:hypothetical protein
LEGAKKKNGGCTEERIRRKTEATHTRKKKEQPEEHTHTPTPIAFVIGAGPSINFLSPG